MTGTVTEAAAFGRRFGIYSIASLPVQLALGTWIGMQGPSVAANLPTPWLGPVQRINIGVDMLWVVVLAIRLMRAEEATASRRSDEARRMRRSAA